jgi:cytosine deaminase
MSPLLVRDVRPWGGATTDLFIDGGVIRSRACSGDEGVEVVDGGGRIVLPSFSDTHVHLDSTRLGLPFRPHSAVSGGVSDQVANDRAHWRDAGAGVAERATYTLGAALVRGMTRARSFAQVDADCGLDRLAGVCAARDAFADRADIEIVAFPQAGILREDGIPELLEAALDNGADLIGGIDPCALDGDPEAHLDVIFDLAEKRGVDLDIHLHEPGRTGKRTLRMILDRARALDYRHRVTISHAFCLAELPEEELLPLLDELAELDVALTTIAPGGRPPLPLPEILSRGIRIGLGQDGQRDYWSPYGSSDMLERAWLLAYSNNFRRDQLVESVAEIATLGGRYVMDGRPQGPADSGRGVGPGEPADLVLLTGDTVTAAVMDRDQDRTVIRAGAVIADGGRLTGTDPLVGTLFEGRLTERDATPGAARAGRG